MLNTVEQLSDTMASSRSRPKPDWSDHVAPSEPSQAQKPDARRPGQQHKEDIRHGNEEDANHQEDRGHFDEDHQGDDDDDRKSGMEEKKLHVTIKDEKTEEEEDQDVPEKGYAKCLFSNSGFSFMVSQTMLILFAANKNLKK